MKIEQFRQEISDYIYAQYSDYEIKNCDVIKNNGVQLCGIGVGKKGEAVCPSIYLEKYYERFLLGDNFDCISKDIIKEACEARYTYDFDPEFYKSFSNVKDYLMVKMVNTDKNQELLKDTPNREFLDLSFVVYCNLEDVFHMNASILVKDAHLKMWGIDRNELIDIAYENTKKACVAIKSLVEVLSDEMNYMDKPHVNMYVMSFDNQYYGAVCMTFSEILDDFLKTRSGGVYILPSSVHEVILLPEANIDGYESSNLNELVKTVNGECLDLEEILADHAYYYSKAEGYLFV